MQLLTTFWNDEKLSFKKLLYIDYKSKEIVFSVDLSDKFATFLFFRSLAKFMKRKRALDTVYHQNNHFQFAVMHEGRVSPIIWFDIMIGEDRFSHDSAFNTTLIKRNGEIQPFGRFPMHTNRRLPKYREFNLKARVFRYLANRVMAA